MTNLQVGDLDLELAYLEELEAQSRGRESFRGFIQYTDPNYEMNWHHAILCDKLEEFAQGKIKRLIVEVPPRRGKSELCSRKLPAYILGKNPNAEVIAASYAMDLASRMNRDVQRVIETPRYQALFPKTQIYGRGVQYDSAIMPIRNNEMFEVVNQRGVYKAAGVGTGITGMGFHYGIIDDPVKSMAEALSKTYRQSVWEWYTSTFLTREMGDACILLILTRWHEDDLAGRLLKLAENDPEADQWERVKFPEVKENNDNPDDPREIGEVLWPGRYNAAKVRKVKASVGSIVWNALYQQRPSLLSGNILQRHWWKRYHNLPNRPFEDRVITCDPTMTDKEGSDFCVFQLWGRIGPDKYLIDQVRAQMDYPTSKRELKNFIAKHGQCTIRVENKANGPALVSELSSTIPGIIEFNPHGSKQARALSYANSASAQLEGGNIWIPHESVAPWTKDFVDECAEFPKGPNDDQVDCFTMAIIHWIERGFDKFDESAPGSQDEDAGQLVDIGTLIGDIMLDDAI
jgi:predicted phage terminase large subunit-like protein